jgi:hypothetical protein
MSKDTKETERSIGDVINELSSNPVAFNLQAGNQVFNLFLHPPGQDIMAGYATLAKDTGNEVDSMLSYFACHCVKDAKGKKIWKKPEDVKIKGVAMTILRNIIYQHIMGVNLSEFALKNSGGSHS